MPTLEFIVSTMAPDRMRVCKCPVYGAKRGLVSGIGIRSVWVADPVVSSCVRSAFNLFSARLDRWAKRVDPEAMREAYAREMLRDQLVISSYDEDDEGASPESAAGLTPDKSALVEIGRLEEELKNARLRYERSKVLDDEAVDEPDYEDVQAEAYGAVPALSAHSKTPEIFRKAASEMHSIIAKAFREQEAREFKQWQSEQEVQDQKD